MAQGVLPYQYKEQVQTPGLTALAGLPAYLDLAHVAGLRDAIRRHLDVRSDSRQGSVLIRHATHVRKSSLPLDTSLEDIYSSPKSTETIRTRTMENSRGDRTS